MNLVIVESPTKARKLTGFLGKEYQVESSVGHIVDLPKSGVNIDIEHDFTPKYEVMPDKRAVVAKLKKLADKAKVIYLASDPDREGEAIAWHLQDVLSDGVVDGKRDRHKEKFKRATFHEITKEAVEEAITHSSKVNLSLVNAQQARRVLDRLVGYQVSPILWRKVRRGLSAGRVQSVALRLIVEREKEIRAFVPEEYWEVGVVVVSKELTKKWQVKDEELLAMIKNNELPEGMFFANLVKVGGKKYEPKKEEEVRGVVEDLLKADYVIASLEKKERKNASYPPFTTSTLQQAAANRLGFTSKQTMTLAQQLYEEGLITYHRTDSFNLSAKAVAQARSYIKKTYGEKYLPETPRVFAKKSKNAQEAHEAIRVTEIKLRELTGSRVGRFTVGHAKLYDLIWRRFVASQMSAAIANQTTVIVEGKKESRVYELKATGSIRKFDGWTKLFPRSEDRLLPELETGQKVYFGKEVAEQKFTQPPARYNDASIIKKLEELGIGRPSTYAAIISVIISRGYVERQAKKFFATSVGETVSDFLLTNLRQFMEYDFTALMEEQLDEIARGEKDWVRVLHDFYQPFSKKLKEVEGAERVAIPVEETGEECPLCGQTEGGMIVIRQGRYGKFKSCSRFPDCKFTQNMQEVVAGVKCPLCREGEVVKKPSRWGKDFYGCSRYPECKWASWKKPEVGETLTKEQWEKMQAEREERKRLREEKRALKGKVKTKTSKKKTRVKRAKKVRK
jgi:DNA topoisomerase-1